MVVAAATDQIWMESMPDFECIYEFADHHHEIANHNWLKKTATGIFQIQSFKIRTEIVNVIVDWSICDQVRRYRVLPWDVTVRDWFDLLIE